MPQLLESYGVPATKPMSKKLVLPPLFREVAVKYSSVKRKIGSPLFSRKLMSELRVGCKDGKDYYCLSGQDEVDYCVRVSDSAETIKKKTPAWVGISGWNTMSLFKNHARGRYDLYPLSGKSKGGNYDQVYRFTYEADCCAKCVLP